MSGGRGLLGLTPSRLAALKAKLAEEGLAGGGGADTPLIPPLPPGVPAPLSFAQESFWFVEQLQPGSGLYNVAFAWYLAGPLDVAALGAALAELARRHAVLRLRVEVRGGQPLQVLSSASPAVLPVIDLSSLAAAEPAFSRLADVEARRPFDLQRGPLHRALLVALGVERSALLLFFHHIVIDRGSMEVYCRELGEIYAALRQGRAAPVPPQRLQYADFAAWQRARFADGAPERERQLGFWRAALAGRSEELSLPTDRPRPPRLSFQLGSLPVAVSRLATERLRALARERGATLFMTGLAAFGAWLSRLAAIDDLLVGAPSSHRERRELQEVMGPFVDLLALRVTTGEVPGSGGLAGLVEQVRERALAAYAHQELPFEALVQELAPHRRADRNPLCQVSFSLDPDEIGSGVELAGLGSRLEILQLSPFQFDLVLRLFDGAAGLYGFLNFQREVFDATTARRWQRQLSALLEAAAADPGAPLAALPLLDPAERHQLAAEWNDTAVDLPDEPFVQRWVLARAAAAPDAVAIVADIADDLALSYGELARRAGRLRRRLTALGTCEPRVALLLDRSPEMVVAMLAVLAAGGAYVPVDPQAPRERIELLLRQSGAAAVLTGDDLRALGDGDPTDLPAAATVFPGQLAYVIHTSGSTGTPKGVAARHDALANVALWHARRYGIAPGDRVTHLASPTFDAAATEVWPTLLSGACLVLPPAEVVASPPALACYLADRQVTLSCLPTPLAEALFAEPVPPGTALRALLTGGEALRRRPGAATPYPVVNHYGPTEATVDATTGTVAPEAADPRLPALGRPLGNVRVYVLDRGGEPVPIGVPGELWIGGMGLSRGYLGQPERTAESFRPDPWGGAGEGGRLYRTGDRTRLLADGEVEFLGRLDRQVKIRGVRIEPGEVQAALGRHPEVRESFVTARPDARGELQLAAYVVPRPGRSPSPGALRDCVAALLPRHLVPAAFTVLAALPLTPQGKVGLEALPAPETAATGSAPPRTPVERVVAGIWEELLGRAPVGREDDFFALGGHSLLATRVLARVRQLCAVEVGIRALFEGATVAELAVAVERARTAAAGPPPPPLVPIPRGPGVELPLSHAQQRLWFLDRLEPGSTVYNLPVAYRLLGRWEPRHLAAALAALVARQESLRTTFPAGPSGPVQSIAPLPRSWHLPVVDLAGLPADRRRAVALALTNTEARRPFDLAAGPLFRPLLLRLSAAEQVLLLALHHAVFDGGSTEVLLSELAALYAVAAAGRSARRGPLPALPVQYADFAVWQRAWLAGPRLDRPLAYWRERLAGAPAVLELPIDRPRPAVQAHRGGLAPVALDAGLAQDLRALGRRSAMPLFMTALAGFLALLRRVSGQADLVVGIPEAGRGRVELEGLIGFFVNTLALRAGLAGDPTDPPMTELLRGVREAALGAYAHAEVPFDRVVEALAPERRLSHSPLFQVVFSLDPAAANPADPAGELRLEPLPLAIGSAKFDLTLALVEAAGGLSGRLEYDRDLFDPATAERLVRHLEILLRGLVAEPSARLAALPLLSAAERHQLLVTWNATATGFPRQATLQSLFAVQARQRPDATAVVHAGQHLSYGGLAARSGALARRLGAAGVGPDVPVALCLERSPELVVAILAVLQAGGAYLPLDPAYPRQRLAFLLADGGAPVVVTTAPLAAALPDAGIPLLLVEERDDGTLPEIPEIPTTGDALAYILYTSGSTGRPKGVAVPHRAVVRLVVDTDYVRFGPGDRVAQAANACFDAATFEIWGALLAGGTLVILPPEVVPLPAALAAALRAEAIGTLFLTAALAHQAAREAPDAFATLTTLIAGGEALDPGMMRRLLAGGPPRRLLNGYGPTESTTFGTWFEIAAVPEGAATVPVGRPLANTRALVCDAALYPLPVGVAGELYLGGDGLARGYWRRPERTAERFVPDPFAAEEGGRPGGRLYATGDRARWRPDGTLEVLGRLDGQVKIRGFRIEPGEIEAVLTAHPEVAQAVILARETPESGERRLVAYLVPAPGTAPGIPGTTELRRFLGERLPAYMVPAHFVRLDALPLTATGKVDRRALPSPDPQAAVEAAGYVAPRTPLEAEVAGIWATVLGVDRVGIHDSFWELGGHSLLATKVLSRLHAALGVDLPLQTLFLTPTVLGLTAALGESLLALAAEESEELLAEPV